MASAIYPGCSFKLPSSVHVQNLWTLQQIASNTAQHIGCLLGSGLLSDARRYIRAEACLPATLMHHLDLGDTLRGWRPDEIDAFGALMTAEGKDLDAIAQRLPGRSVSEVVRFYYDVWKTRRLPQARQWYLRRQQASISYRNYNMLFQFNLRPRTR